MDCFTRHGTERTPEIVFDFGRGIFSIRGESYPEDVATFYGPVMSSLKEFLSGNRTRSLTLEIELIYFNSSSAKVLMNLFLLLENAAGAENQITVNWYYQGDDETMREFGEEFSEDVRHINFHVLERNGAPPPQ
ncbi:SiaC family regulatory phosphoprotein domain-containing protein [uncultured Gammaproteobacteria bacterium]